MRHVVMAMLMAYVCLDLSLAHAASPDQRESLRGLPGVQVLIEDIRPDAQADGLSQEAIRTAVELILRSSGIRVLTQSERLETPSKPYLSVHVGTDKHASGQYSFNARVELHQQRRDRSPRNSVSPCTGFYSARSRTDSLSDG